MALPEASVKLLVDWLFKRTSPDSLELFNALLDVSKWIGELLLDDGTLLKVSHYRADDGEAAVELQALHDNFLHGVKNTSAVVPGWMLPFLTRKTHELLNKS